MRKGRLFVSILVITLLATTAFTGFALAFGPPSGKVSPGLAQKGDDWKGHGRFRFNDVSQGYWAQGVIEQMAAAGIVKGRKVGEFQPKEPVKQSEAIVMAVRALELEGETPDEEYVEIARQYGYPLWARTSVALALQHGVVDEDYLRSRNANKPASRLDVMMMMVRALGLTEQAGNGADIPFADSHQIPEELRGYVGQALLQGLLGGYGDKTLRPNQAVKRAEMAAFCSRLMERFGWRFGLKDKIVGAFIVSVDADNSEITIQRRDWSEPKTYTVAEDAAIKLDGNEATLADLTADLNVKAFLQDGEIIWLEAKTGEGENLDEIEAVFVDFTDPEDGPTTITVTRTVNDVDIDVELTLCEDVTIEKDGEQITLAGLVPGDILEIKFNGNGLVCEIKVEGPEPVEREIKGTIQEVDADNSTITVEYLADEGEQTETVAVEEDAEITLDGEECTLAGLSAGLLVELELENEVAVKVEAETPVPEERDVSGRIAAVDVDGLTITVTLDGEEGSVIVAVDEDTEITLDGEECELAGLSAGLLVEIGIEGDVAVKVEAETPEEEELVITGVLVSVNNDDSTITLSVTTSEGTDEITYSFSEDVEVFRNGEEAALLDLVVGDTVACTTDGNVIIRIEAEEQEEPQPVPDADTDTDTIVAIGVIEAINPAENTLTVNVGNLSMMVTIDSDTEILLDDTEAQLTDLSVGLDVTVETEGGVAIRITATS